LFRERALARFAVLAVLFVLAASLSGQASNRPLGVPEEFVITPFGYFHPSCVLALTEGDTLLADGRVEHADGRADANVPFCNYAHYTRTGVLVLGDGEALRGIDPPTISGWLEYVSVSTTSSYGKISAMWKVPPAPTAQDGQVLFFFPGFEDYSDVISIVQPVLQFGASAGGGGNYWAMESWNCCINGQAWYSPLLQVSAGDTIFGAITSNCKPGSSSCSTWNVVSRDVTTGKATTLAKTPVGGQVWNWAFGAVTEDYGVNKCTEFPANTGLTFNVRLYDQNGTLIASPAWKGSPASSGTTPKCAYGVVETPTRESVKY